MLIERRLLQRICEKSFKFFDQFKRENDNFKTQSEMTMLLLNDLLDFAQMKSDAFRISYEYVDLTKLVK